MSLISKSARVLANHRTGDTLVYVAGGNVVSDAELAERLEVSQGTIAKWRSRLRAAGMIGWLVAQGQGRVFWIDLVNHRMPSELKASAPSRQEY